MHDLPSERKGDVERVIRGFSDYAGARRETRNWTTDDFLYAIDRLQNLRLESDWKEKLPLYQNLLQEHEARTAGANDQAEKAALRAEIQRLREQQEKAAADNRKSAADREAKEALRAKRETRLKWTHLFVGSAITAVIGSLWQMLFG